jgi:hypothetical protein
MRWPLVWTSCANSLGLGLETLADPYGVVDSSPFRRQFEIGRWMPSTAFAMSLLSIACCCWRFVQISYAVEDISAMPARGDHYLWREL